eukprot:TRINITY_DN2730_c0_g2_i1.p1 TRINITY_DN2730_c0_g2~~TRINITY_DN2730_c0_g2_i1.p1  ORF type:complete len:350 (+),score=49.49 TRINITY_DN2730_c0_g2_i1:51-1052(+)
MPSLCAQLRQAASRESQKVATVKAALETHRKFESIWVADQDPLPEPLPRSVIAPSAVEFVLANRSLCVIVASWVPCQYLGYLIAACRAVVLDEHFWRHRFQSEFCLGGALDGSWLEAYKEQATARFSPGPLDWYELPDIVSPIVKVVSLGDSGVGKSSFTIRFSGDGFSDRFDRCIGLDIRQRVVRLGDTHVRLRLWDFAGHERFRSVYKGYLRGAHVVLMFYDCTDLQSFENVRRTISLVPEDAIVSLVALKCDLAIERQVSIEDGAALAIELSNKFGDVQFTEASCKTGEGVERALVKVARQCIQMFGLHSEKQSDARVECSRPNSVCALM